MIEYGDYEYIFDDVQFGIDVRKRRLELELKQWQLARLVGYREGVSISRIECAKMTDEISLRRFYRLCGVLSLNPQHYTDVQVKEA